MCPVRKYSRVLLRWSPGPIANHLGAGLDIVSLRHVAAELRGLMQLGVQVAVMGNAAHLFRPLPGPTWGLDKVDNEAILALASTLYTSTFRSILAAESERSVRIMSTTTPLQADSDSYSRLHALHLLNTGSAIIFADPVRDPTTTLDTGTVERAVEIKARGILVGLRGQDGVYEEEVAVASRRRYATLHFEDALRLGNRFVGPDTLERAQSHNMPIHLFDISQAESMRRICTGEDIGTCIADKETRFAD